MTNHRIDRRSLLVGGAAAAAVGAALPLASIVAGPPSPRRRVLEPRETEFELIAGVQTRSLLSYADRGPAPELRVRQGEPMSALLRNALNEPTTIHWHGIRLPNAVDGVPFLTQPYVHKGETFEYTFTPPDAGTYWYHPHCNSLVQMSRGLGGLLIVEEARAPGYDADIALNLRDWRLGPDGQLTDLYVPRQTARAGTYGTVRTANWRQAPAYDVPSGGLVRLRLAATDVTRVYRPAIEGAGAVAIALDGNPLGIPQALGRDSLAPGQRMDLVIRMPDEEEWTVVLRDLSSQNAVTLANKTLRIDGKDVDASRITADLLRDALHEAGGLRANVATGWHAIEFLLWGQDLNGTGPGAGNRPHTDYDLAACTSGNCERRAEYLRVATQLLVEELAWMVEQWQPTGEAYQGIVARPADEALVAIFSGIASLSYGELAGERMKLALLLHDPEEEHDCFSDNSHNSHYWDLVGIQNVYLGRYRRADGATVSGPSISDIVKAKSPAADADVRNALAHSVGRMQAIVDKGKQGMAFDQLIAEGNAEGNRVVQDAIDALLAQTAALRRAVALLDLKGLTVLDSDSLRAPGTVKKRN